MTVSPAPQPTEPSLQERFAPTDRCFGCGPANPDGLHLRSRPDPGDPSVLVAEFQPKARYEALTGIVNGGILGTLLDCHANWTAAWALMRAGGLDRPPATVTLEFSIRLRRPTPSDAPIHLRSRVAAQSEDRATIDVEISSGGVVTASGSGTFVAVAPGHPAYRRW